MAGSKPAAKPPERSPRHAAAAANPAPAADGVPVNPPHPGVILHAEMLHASINPREMADALKVPASRISQILNGERSISADTALRLERYFGAPATAWLEDQNAYDLWCVNREEIERDVVPMQGREPAPAKKTAAPRRAPAEP